MFKDHRYEKGPAKQTEEKQPVRKENQGSVEDSQKWSEERDSRRSESSLWELVLRGLVSWVWTTDHWYC